MYQSLGRDSLEACSMPRFTPISSFHLQVVALNNFFSQIENCFILTFSPQFVLLQVVLMDHFCKIAVSDHFYCRLLYNLTILTVGPISWLFGPKLSLTSGLNWPCRCLDCIRIQSVQFWHCWGFQITRASEQPPERSFVCACEIAQFTLLFRVLCPCASMLCVCEIAQFSSLFCVSLCEFAPLFPSSASFVGPQQASAALLVAGLHYNGLDTQT